LTFDLESSSPPDTGKGKELKTGNLKRSYNMQECKPGQVYDKATKKCVMKKMPGNDKPKWMQGDAKMGPGPDESPTLRESLRHKAGIEKSEKIESGIKKYPRTFKKYKKYEG